MNLSPMNFTPVNATNSDQAIRILAEAFADDPVVNWTCNQPAALDAFFQITLPVFIPPAALR